MDAIPPPICRSDWTVEQVAQQASFRSRASDGARQWLQEHGCWLVVEPVVAGEQSDHLRKRHARKRTALGTERPPSSLAGGSLSFGRPLSPLLLLCTCYWIIDQLNPLSSQGRLTRLTPFPQAPLLGVGPAAAQEEAGEATRADHSLPPAWSLLPRLPGRRQQDRSTSKSYKSIE